MSAPSVTQTSGLSGFPFKEILQHYAQTGRTGKFELQHQGQNGVLFLMTGFVVCCECNGQEGEQAFYTIANWNQPIYNWIDSEAAPSFTMSMTVEELLLRSIQIGSGQALPPASSTPSFSSTEASSDANATRGIGANGAINPIYIMSLDVASSEIKSFRFVIKTPQISVGRSNENELVITDTSLSRKHAIMDMSNDSLLVRDLGSMNGTLIDGQRIVQGIVRNGQTIQFGEVACKLSVSMTDRGATMSPTTTQPSTGIVRTNQ